MVRAYWRCNSGHYFATAFCPLDGWSSAESVALAAAAGGVSKRGGRVSIEALRVWGVSEAAIQRCIVVEFGAQDAAFDALAPDRYLVDGSWISTPQLGSRFT